MYSCMYYLNLLSLSGTLLICTSVCMYKTCGNSLEYARHTILNVRCQKEMTLHQFRPVILISTKCYIFLSMPHFNVEGRQEGAGEFKLGNEMAFLKQFI